MITEIGSTASSAAAMSAARTPHSSRTTKYSNPTVATAMRTWTKMTTDSRSPVSDVRTAIIAG